MVWNFVETNTRFLKVFNLYNTVFITNTKCSTISATLRKINYVPAKTSALPISPPYQLCHCNFSKKYLVNWVRQLNYLEEKNQKASFFLTLRAISFYGLHCTLMNSRTSINEAGWGWEKVIRCKGLFMLMLPLKKQYSNYSLHFYV